MYSMAQCSGNVHVVHALCVNAVIIRNAIRNIKYSLTSRLPVWLELHVNVDCFIGVS